MALYKLLLLLLLLEDYDKNCNTGPSVKRMTVRKAAAVDRYMYRSVGDAAAADYQLSCKSDRCIIVA